MLFLLIPVVSVLPNLPCSSCGRFISSFLICYSCGSFIFFLSSFSPTQSCGQLVKTYHIFRLVLPVNVREFDGMCYKLHMLQLLCIHQRGRHLLDQHLCYPNCKLIVYLLTLGICVQVLHLIVDSSCYFPSFLSPSSCTTYRTPS